jgi:hypothetical protein
MRRILRLLLPVFALALLIPVTVSATAAEDTTPPVWKKLPTNSMPVGAELWPAGSWDDECTYIQMPVTVTWRATDPESGIDHYGYGLEDDETSVGNLGLVTNATLWSYVEDDVCGGGGSDQEFYAFNGAGLWAHANWRANALSVVQDDGGWWPVGSAEQPGGPALSYRKSWSTSTCKCWSDRTTQKTSKRRASVAVTVPASYGGTHGLGIVMAKGPNRGKAAIRVDGVKVATIDTYSPTKVNRTVVWRQALTSGSHTVKVVNRATPGRPRIDIDAFVLLDKKTSTPLPN